MSNHKKLFGTDGVRGLANTFPMTVEVALALGRAAGVVFRRHNGKHRVVIGKDTRLSSYMFENALISGLCSMGVDTLMLGPLPTPGVAFITRAYRADAGIVISASHNKFHDNGIKFFSSDGFKLPDLLEREIEELAIRNNFSECLPPPDQIGRNTKIVDAAGRYVEYVKGTFPRKKSLKNLSIVLDCANGAAYHVAPLVFQELDAKVHVVGNTPNGLNINEKCGSLHPEVIQKAVIEKQADAGIALDGDGDRVIMVDENSQIVDGDQLLAICAHDMLKKGLLPNRRIVGTVMSNLGFLRAMEELQIDVIRSQVGDRYVIQEMLNHQAILGGEPSGHLIHLDYGTTGDGLCSALQVLRIMIETDSKLSDLAAIAPRYPQTLVNVPVRSKPPIEEIAGLAPLTAQAEEQLGKAGRILVRYSGTENVCRIMVEGPKKKQIAQIAAQLAAAVTQAIGIGV
jgi:phosphoglucosamine mutase